MSVLDQAVIVWKSKQYCTYARRDRMAYQEGKKYDFLTGCQLDRVSIAPSNVNFGMGLFVTTDLKVGSPCGSFRGHVLKDRKYYDTRLSVNSDLLKNSGLRFVFDPKHSPAHYSQWSTTPNARVVMEVPLTYWSARYRATFYLEATRDLKKWEEITLDPSRYPLNSYSVDKVKIPASVQDRHGPHLPYHAESDSDDVPHSGGEEEVEIKEEKELKSPVVPINLSSPVSPSYSPTLDAMPSLELPPAVVNFLIGNGQPYRPEFPRHDGSVSPLPPASSIALPFFIPVGDEPVIVAACIRKRKYTVVD